MCLVELASITESSAVARAAAATFGLPEQGGRPPLELLKYALRDDVVLLILDNCEQVLQGCAELAHEILSGCPGVRILATSRERLGIVGETIWRVPSMALPSEAMPPEQMSACDATQLFLQRVMALVTDFAVSDDNSSAVARVCIQLGGIPLAIELAAAQLPALSIQQIAQELDDARRLLVRGNRVALPRQQTLGATIAWSYDLLDPEERLLFDRLSVFAGGWSLDAAKVVCADPEHTGSEVRIRDRDVIDLLARLVSKSLVVANPNTKGSTRYSMLETLRQYGHEQLVERAQLHAMHDRHAALFLSWARRHMSPTDTLFPLVETLVELDNLRVAVVASLALAAVVGGSAVQAAPADQNVSIDRFAFSPAEVTVGVGTSVVWTNQQSGVPHTSTSRDGLWDSDVLATNKTFSFTFNQLGDFAYQCDIHPSMRGVVHVTADTSAEPTSGSVLDQSESTSSTVSAYPLQSWSRRQLQAAATETTANAATVLRR